MSYRLLSRTKKNTISNKPGENRKNGRGGHITKHVSRLLLVLASSLPSVEAPANAPTFSSVEVVSLLYYYDYDYDYYYYTSCLSEQVFEFTPVNHFSQNIYFTVVSIDLKESSQACQLRPSFIICSV